MDDWGWGGSGFKIYLPWPCRCGVRKCLMLPLPLLHASRCQTHRRRRRRQRLGNSRFGGDVATDPRVSCQKKKKKKGIWSGGVWFLGGKCHWQTRWWPLATRRWFQRQRQEYLRAFQELNWRNLRKKNGFLKPSYWKTIGFPFSPRWGAISGSKGRQEPPHPTLFRAASLRGKN